MALNKRAETNKEHQASIHTEICSNTERKRVTRRQASKQTNMVAQWTFYSFKKADCSWTLLPLW